MRNHVKIFHGIAWLCGWGCRGICLVVIVSTISRSQLSYLELFLRWYWQNVLQTCHGLDGSFDSPQSLYLRKCRSNRLTNQLTQIIGRILKPIWNGTTNRLSQMIGGILQTLNRYAREGVWGRFHGCHGAFDSFQSFNLRECRRNRPASRLSEMIGWILEYLLDRNTGDGVW